MIRFNRQIDYAIRIILALARHPFGTRKSTSLIREEMSIPHALSQRIVAKLAQGEFIHTYPGRDGGLELARPSDQINMLQIVEFMQGTIVVSDCLDTGEDRCSLENECPVRKRWAKLQNMIYNELKNQTFDILAEEALEVESVSHNPLDNRGIR